MCCFWYYSGDSQVGVPCHVLLLCDSACSQDSGWLWTEASEIPHQRAARFVDEFWPCPWSHNTGPKLRMEAVSSRPWLAAAQQERLTQRFLQEGHLACVIETVLRYANELRIGRVRRLRHQRLVQTLLRKAPDRPPELGVELFQHCARIHSSSRHSVPGRWASPQTP